MRPDELRGALLGWYRAHARDLPWRGDANPYRVLLSEVLLQQTRVDQAIPYYHRFLQNFPTLEALGRADLESVLKVWQGVGYYARARNLHKLAQTTPELPHTYAELLRLPGIGPYTAAAVASIVFGESVAAVDGNVRRVVARLEAKSNPTPSEVQSKADQLLAPDAPGDWNQAMMELGATVCVPKRPRCPDCPINAWCQGKAQPHLFPSPKARKQTSVEAVALVLVGEGGVHLEPRVGSVLGGLWGVPMEEGEGALERLQARFGVEARYLGEILHAFTHRRLRVRVYQAPWAAAEIPAERPLSRLDQKILALALP
ncbi:MAG: A/G-specific adenine glycosylase [Meiothermus sp.]|nr:A/G-specific adenine glycosylase [Meiothermus sp.]